MPKLGVYCMYKTELCVEKYLLLDMPRHFKSVLANVRVGNHDLEIERGRQLNKRRDERYCKFCLTRNQMFVEDEYHVIFECLLYNDLRHTYIEDNTIPRNLFTFCSLLSSENVNVIKKTAKYLYHAFALRKSSMENIVYVT